jgi:altronate dehydratase
MNNKENLKDKKLETDITFNARITIQERMSKNDNIYQVMVIGIENEKTGEILNIHEVYIKEHLRQIIEFIISQNKE